MKLDPADGAKRPAAGLASFQPPYALYDQFPPMSPEQLERNLTDYLHELNAAGLTGVYSLGRSPFLAARAAKGPLPVRLWETLPFDARDPASGRRGRGADRAQSPEPVRRPLRHRSALARCSTGRSSISRRGPIRGPRQIMDEYTKLAVAAARGAGTCIST